MIVLSGALVLVALVLLVVGALGRDLPYVYGSIGVSMTALLLLFLSILQRRGRVDGGDSTVEVQVAAADEGERVPALVGAAQPGSDDSTAAPSDGSAAAPPAQAPVSRLGRRPRTPEQDEAEPDDVLGRNGAGRYDDPSLEHDEAYDEAYDEDGEPGDADEPFHAEGEAEDDDEAYEDDDEAYEDDDEAYEDEGAPAAADDRSTADDRDLRLVPSSGTAADPAPSPEVLVVAGRPRYHLSGCRYLIGKSPEHLGIDDAQARGFSPCGVCKPDTVLAEQPDVAPAGESSADRPSERSRPAAEQRQDALASGEQAVHQRSAADERDEPSEDEHPDGELLADEQFQDEHVEDEHVEDERLDGQLEDSQLEDERLDGERLDGGRRQDGGLLEDAPLDERQDDDEQVEDERLDDEQRHDDATLGHAVPVTRASAPVAADQPPTNEQALVGGRVLGRRSGRPDDGEPVPAHPTDATRQLEPTVSGSSATQASREPEPSAHDPAQLEPTASDAGPVDPTQPPLQAAEEGSDQQAEHPAVAPGDDRAEDGATNPVRAQASRSAAFATAGEAPVSLTATDAAAGEADVPSGGDAPVDTTAGAQPSPAAARTSGPGDTSPDADTPQTAAEALGLVDTAREAEVPAPTATTRAKAAATPATAAESEARAPRTAKAAKAARAAKAPARAAKAAKAAKAATAPAEPPPSAKAAPAKAASAKAASAKAASAKAASAKAASAKAAPAKAAPAKAARTTAEQTPSPVRTTPVRVVRADALRLTSPAGATTTRRVAVRADAGVRPPSSAAARPASPPAAPAGTGAAPARSTGRVVVIPDRGRFHRAECRYVRGAEDATTLTKAAAAKQGYVPCGVCQP